MLLVMVPVREVTVAAAVAMTVAEVAVKAVAECF